MSKIAIKGHPTRGKEVIELLEMLGGVDWHGFSGNRLDSVYYISDSKSISFDDTYDIVFEDGIKEFITFTIEEFLEKFPYKVGDKVNSPCKGCIKTITSMEWDTCRNNVTYKLDNRIYTNIDQLKVVNDLQSYKEETMEEVDKAMAPNLVGEDYSGKRFGYKIPNGYEFDCIKNNEIILKPKQPKYPISYKECCTYLGLQHCGLTIDLPFNYSPLFISLAQLYICRNAYWKIAGDEMDLGKPWEPDWKNTKNVKYAITLFDDIITKMYLRNENVILAFPTEEMRDAFYENFKDLIECCKELL